MTALWLSTSFLCLCVAEREFCNSNELTTISKMRLDLGCSSTKITPEAHFYEDKTGLFARHPRQLCEMVVVS